MHPAVVVNGSSGAFGPINVSTTQMRRGVEARADEGPRLHPWPEDLRERLDEETATMLSAFHAFVVGASPDMYRPDSEAAYSVLHHAMNDVLALVDHVVRGDGRSAARAARALCEHLVNYADVTTSSDMTERYMSHTHVTDDLIAQRALYFRAPGGGHRPRQTKWQREMQRVARQPLAQALDAYGTAYRRGFTPRTFRDRANEHEYPDAYDGYRILSGVMHGAAGGLHGTRETIRGSMVLRVGPDLRLAALAYVEGMNWWCQLLERVLAQQSSSRLDVLAGVSKYLRDAWPRISDALHAMDRALWPVDPPAPVHTVLALYPRGDRWYVHRPSEWTLTLAVPPQGEDAVRAVREARLAYGDYRPADAGGRPMTFAVPHINVDEAAGAPTINSAGILMPQDVLGGLRALEDR